MLMVLPFTVTWRVVSIGASRPRSRSQLTSTRTARAMPPPIKSEGRARRKPAIVPEPASGDMGNALGQGGQLAGGTSLGHREMEGEEIEVGGVELEIAERAAGQEEVGKRGAAACH